MATPSFLLLIQRSWRLRMHSKMGCCAGNRQGKVVPGNSKWPGIVWLSRLLVGSNKKSKTITHFLSARWAMEAGILDQTTTRVIILHKLSTDGKVSRLITQAPVTLASMTVTGADFYS
jgi:hypothetical protein